ncbi:YciI family protein [Antrihabitans cavernicola]|nr:YciI family protein [Spelaeibacter cavernicola]
MMLIYSNAESWAALSHDERIALGRGHAALKKELEDAGKYAGGHGLSDPRETTTVRVRAGAIATTDGPYIESKEHLAGFYVVECADVDEATAIAARIPDAAVNFVEVRPVLDPPEIPAQ